MELVFIALVLVGVLAYIAAPLFAATRARVAPAARANESLLIERDAAYAALRDLDFDFQLGKLSERDYHALRERAKANAAQILQQLDAASMPDNGHATLDSGPQTADADDIERAVAQVRAARRKADAHCGNCGKPYHAGDQFCARCGNKL